MQKIPRPVVNLLRFAMMAIALALVFARVPLADIWPLLSHIPILLLISVLLLIHATQIIGALRTRFYVTGYGIDLSAKTAIQLHYVGELFSAVLPGGAGGDVYKAWWLKNYQQAKTSSMIKVMLASRLNGLWALGALTCLLAIISGLPALELPVRWLTMGALMAGTLGYGLFARYVFGEFWRQQMTAALYSLALQALLGIAVWLICLGLGLTAHAIDYIILYMVSCVVALLPISIGGIGVRELTLLHGSLLLHLDADRGVALAFALTVISLSVPLVGAVIQNFWHSHKAKQMPMET